MTPRAALDLLGVLGASPWLVRHHELVLEAAVLICDQLARSWPLPFDRAVVLAGAALHDAGKIVHAEEMSAPGSEHEAAGRELLLGRGVPAGLARFCVTHAAWGAPDCTIEDRLVALADKLWKESAPVSSSSASSRTSAPRSERRHGPCLIASMRCASPSRRTARSDSLARWCSVCPCGCFGPQLLGYE